MHQALKDAALLAGVAAWITVWTLALVTIADRASSGGKR